MIYRLGTAPRQDGITREAFQGHWRTSHADVVSHLPGLHHYQQFHAVLQDGLPLRPDPGFDACSVLRFESFAEMDAAFSAQHFVNDVQADEAQFVDKTRFRGVVGHWQPDSSANLGTEMPIHVLTFLTAEPGASVEELRSRLLGTADADFAGMLIADPAAHEGRFPLFANIVRIVGYQDIESALIGAEVTRHSVGSGTVIGEQIARIVDVPIGTLADGTKERKKHDSSN